MARRLRSQIQRGARNAVQGRRGARAVRRVIDRPEYDGDNDGFITNPLTGRDEIPWNRATESAEEAIRKFFGGKIPESVGRTIGQLEGTGQIRRRSGPRQTTIGRRPIAQSERLRSLGGVLGTSESLVPRRLNSPATPGSSQPPLTTAEMINRLALAFLPQVKEVAGRDAAFFKNYVNDVDAILNKKFGKLETLEDFRAAFKQYTRTYLLGFGQTLDDDDRAFLSGVLYAVTLTPELFKAQKFLSLRKKFGEGGSAGAGTASLSPIKRVQSSASLPALVKGGGVIIDYFRSLKTDLNEYMGTRMDTISAQSAMAVLRDRRGSDITKPADGEDSDALLRDMVRVAETMTGIHESFHAIHNQRGWLDLFPTGQQSGAEVMAALMRTAGQHRDELIEHNAARLVDQLFRNELKDIALLEYQFQRWQLEDPSARSNASYPDFFRDKMMNTPPGSDEQLWWLQFATVTQQHFLQGWYDVYALLGNPQHKELQDALGALMMGDRTPLAKIQMEDRAKIMAFFKDFLALEGEDMAGYKAGFGVPDLLEMAALRMQAPKQWDDLTDQEIADFRSALKYISSYAKDKYSWYRGDFPERPSLEGVAEIAALWLANGRSMPPVIDRNTGKDKLTPARRAAIDKMFTWLLGYDALIQGLKNQTGTP